MENLRELINAKFTHMSAKIEAQGTLLEEKMARANDRISNQLDEVIRHQKVSNGNVADLQKEAEKNKKHRIEAAVIPIWRRIPLYVVIPVVFTIAGFAVNDHYTIKDLKRHTVSDSAFLNVQSDWWMHTEKKSRAYESMTKGNYNAIQTLDSAQAKIDSFLIEKYRVRSLRENSLPEF